MPSFFSSFGGGNEIHGHHNPHNQKLSTGYQYQQPQVISHHGLNYG
jgi:hypothetical protein